MSLAEPDRSILQGRIPRLHSCRISATMTIALEPRSPQLRGDRIDPAPAFASAEVVTAIAIIVAGVWRDFGFTPELLLVLAIVLCRWRGPTWREMGLRRMSMPVALLAIAVGVGYQFV